MIPFPTITCEIDRLGLDYEWMDGMMLIQSRRKELLAQLYDWCIEHEVFVTQVDAVPDTEGLYEVQIDPEY